MVKGRRLKPFRERESTPERIRDAAIALITAESSQGLTLRALAARAGVFFTAPQHHFGSVVGLLAAVAEKGFTELARELGRARSSQSGKSRRCIATARAHARFALGQGALYQALHDNRLWSAKEAPESGAAGEKQKHWLERARGARLAAFREYELAVSEDQARHLLDARAKPDEVAHFLAVLVDGYVFQVLQEHIHPGFSVHQHLAWLERLLDCAIRGLPSRRKP